MQIRATERNVEIITRFCAGQQLVAGVTDASTGNLRSRVLSRLLTRQYNAATTLQGGLVGENLSRSIKWGRP